MYQEPQGAHGVQFRVLRNNFLCFSDNNIMLWNAVIFGPHDTPFEDGTFKLTIEFTEEYPNKPPTVRFVSKMFHPNVYAGLLTKYSNLNPFILNSFQMVASVWTFCKTVGPRPTMFLQFLPQSSHCWMNPTPTPQLTTWLPSSIRFDYFSHYLG